MKIPFKTNINDGNENVMLLGEINPSEIRFNRITKEISLVCYDTYTLEDLDGISWQAVRELVLKNNGKWTTKASGIKYLIGKEK